MSALSRTLRLHAVAIALAVVALAIAWTYAATSLRRSTEMGLPLDDSYIYLTYAKQMGSGRPFTYFDGSSYSAGATSLTWPAMLAPLWTLGARGHALVWAAFIWCALLYAWCAVAAYRIARTIADPHTSGPGLEATPRASDASLEQNSRASDDAGLEQKPRASDDDGRRPRASRLARESIGIVAGAIVLSIAAFAWTALSGMEVALTSASLLAIVALLIARSSSSSSSSPSSSSPSSSSPSSSSPSSSSPSSVTRATDDSRGHAAPSRALIACLVVAALARPEAAVLVALVCIAHAVVHRRSRRALVLWLVPLIAPISWLVMNRVLAGHWMPSTAIAKSQWFQPGFEVGAWASAFATNAGKLVRGLFWDPNSPLPQARLFGIAWLVGCVRVVWWARSRDASARVVAAMIVGAPIAWCAMVLAASGLWTLHQYRYIAPVMPLLAIPVAIAIAPVARWAWSSRVTIGTSVVIVVVAVWFGVLRHRVSAITYAQGVADTNAQVVKIGRYVHDKLPAARVMLHDAGAIAYYGDGPIVDMLGLVTDDTMGVAANGPGARFEYLENLPVENRPTHIAYYPGWLGTQDFTGRLVMDTPWGPQFARERVVAGRNMELYEASWDHVGTGERLLRSTSDWHIVDRVDVADLASERAHAWSGAMGTRRFVEPTTTWSFVMREVTERGLVIDGGRLIRGGHEAFTIARDATKPAKLVLRSGGAAIAGYAPITNPVTLKITADGAPVGEIVVPAPTGRMVEIELALPVGSGSRIAVRASAPYRVSHWFVMQPNSPR
jgi:hypothetical protein